MGLGIVGETCASAEGVLADAGLEVTSVPLPVSFSGVAELSVSEESVLVDGVVSGELFMVVSAWEGGLCVDSEGEVVKAEATVPLFPGMLNVVKLCIVLGRVLGESNSAVTSLRLIVVCVELLPFDVRVYPSPESEVAAVRVLTSVKVLLASAEGLVVSWEGVLVGAGVVVTWVPLVLPFSVGL